MSNQKRILKEILDIQRNPIENIIISISENGIYDIYFLMKFYDYPYNNLYLYGKLKLSEKYPYSASDFFCYTPSGRFETNKKICTNSSSYHQESFNATYNIRNLLISLYSFVYEESTGIGSINSTDEKRIEYSNKSLEFNKNIKLFNELFLERLSEFEKKITNNIEINQTLLCRICLQEDIIENLIIPCECKGTQKYAHLKCLEESQINYILNQSSHPDYQKNIDEVCSICGTNYKYKAKSRDELFKEYTKDIAGKLQTGMLLISSKESSDYNNKIIQQNKNNIQLVQNISYWTNSIILITEDLHHYLGVILTLQIKQSNNFDNYINHYKIDKKLYKDINIYLGGPCEKQIIYSIILINSTFLNEFNIELKNIKIIEKTDNTSLLFGELFFINQLAKIYHHFTKQQVVLYAFEGISGWSKVNGEQLLAEISKGSWILSRASINNFPYNNMWEHLEKNGLKCPKNPYSSNYEEDDL